MAKFPTRNELDALKKKNAEIKASGANVRILPGPSNPARQKYINAQRTAQTINAESGETAARVAYEKEQQNKTAKEIGVSKPKTVKIDSNPVKPGNTTVSPLAKKRGPSKLASFGGGMGGMFSPKNR